MGDKKWCPQHGYPLPCDKCGMPLTQQKEIEAKDEKIVVEPIPFERAMEEIYKAGMRRVVEWFMENYPEACDEYLQAQLKEWGL